MRNMCETCGEAGEFSRGKSISYLTAFLRNLNDTYEKLGGYGLLWLTRIDFLQSAWFGPD